MATLSGLSTGEFDSVSSVSLKLNGVDVESALATKITADSVDTLTNKSISYSQISDPPTLYVPTVFTHLVIINLY